jgi:CheY-like chemotaxis protein
MKALIVDDDKVTRTVLKTFLRSRTSGGVLEAENGLQGLTAVTKDAPDVVFLDLNRAVMPFATDDDRFLVTVTVERGATP